MSKKRKKYTREFRDSAVKLITEQGYQIAEAARNLGVSVARVTLNALLETITGNKLHKLTKYRISSPRANPPFLYWYLTPPSQI